ncbi:FtsX-like permease family protein [Modestobacter versicolor]|uniref:FtsX-like permease family protein n=1 Tax=Modestobacter versicolor TaxID=429133 RepID=UPI0034DEBE83
MLHLAVRMVRSRFVALLAVACAVLGGAALVTGTGVLTESGLRSHVAAGRLAAADVVVAADQTLGVPGDLPVALPERSRVPAELVGELAALPGVTAAVGDLGFPAALVDDAGAVVPVPDPATAGHGWSSTGLATDARTQGTPPEGPAEVALSRDLAAAAGVATGDDVTVVAAGETGTWTVSALVDAPGVFFADDTAADLAAQAGAAAAGQVDLVGLRTEPGATDRVADAAADLVAGSGLVVATGDDRGDLGEPGAAAARPLLLLLSGSLGGIVLLVVGFAVAGALGVSIAGQRRELALLRAVGATPRQVRRLATDQAMVVAALAVVPGVALGFLLAGQMRRLLVDVGMLPAALPLTVSPLPGLAAVLLLAAVVWVSALGASWRTSRLPATEAVAESRTEPRSPSRVRTLVGGLLVVAATVLGTTPLFVRSDLGAALVPLAGLVGAIGAALAGPAVLRWAGDVVAPRLPAQLSAPSWLAVANLRGYTTRVAGVVSSLAMVVVFALTYVLSTTTLISAGARDLQTGTLAQHSVGAGALGGVPGDLPAEVADLPGVTAAVPTGTTTVAWEYSELGEPTVESGSALVADPAAARVLDLDVRDGALADLTGATVAVGSDVARSRDAGLGESVELVLGDGAPVEARVVAVYDRTLGFGPVVLAADLAAGHTSAGLAQQLLVRTDGSAAAREGLAALVADRPGLTLGDAAPRETSLADAPGEVWLNLATVSVLVGYLLLSIVNKLVAVTSQRRGEIAVLRLTGSTPRQVRSMMRREAAVLTGVSLAAGLALSAVPLLALGIGFLGRPWPAGPVWLAPAAALVVAAIAVLTTELPTRRALRAEPASALSHAG